MNGFNKRIISRDKLFACWDLDIKNNDMFYIYSVLGSGKTTAVYSWLNSRKFSYVFTSAGTSDFIASLKNIDIEQTDIIIIDDLTFIPNKTIEKMLSGYIDKCNCKIIFISRGSMPPFLKPLLIAKQVREYSYNDLAFSLLEFKELIKVYNIKLSDYYTRELYRLSRGWAFSLFLCVHKLRHGATVNERFYTDVKADIFDCFDNLIYINWDDETKIFLLTMADFFPYTKELGSLFFAPEKCGRIIDNIIVKSSFLSYSDDNKIIFAFELFREYLLKKQKEYFTKEKIVKLHLLGAEYYEKNGDTLFALDHYKKAGNYTKIAELLTKHSKKHPGITDYYSIKDYYFALPEELIERSPLLMSGMSMLCSLCMKFDESEKWLGELETFRNNASKKTNAYKEASEAVLYLKIALPHRGDLNLQSTIIDAAKVCINGGIKIREFSATGNMPGIMNGGKDFSDWSAHDRLLYKTIKAPVELILGKRSEGLADIGLAESLYEKSTTENFAEIINYLNLGLSKAKANENLHLQFAGTGVLARLYAAQAQMSTALSIIDRLYSSTMRKEKQLQKNIEAYKVKQNMMLGNNQPAIIWVNNSAPDENKDFYILDRYRYLIKARVYIQQKKYLDAVSLLTRLLNYFSAYKRPYGEAESNMLYAITLYRMGNEEYAEAMNKSLKFFSANGFIRPIADEGAPVYEILQKVKYENTAYFETLLKETKKQTVIYRDYLSSKNMITEPLTETEKSVLRLIVDGMSNKDIAELLCVSVPTVKFHASNIYKKIHVKNRVAAIKIAEEVGMELL